MTLQGLLAHWRKEAKRLKGSGGPESNPVGYGVAQGLYESASQLEDVLKNRPSSVTSLPLNLTELTETALRMFQVKPSAAIKAAEDAEEGGEGRISATLFVQHHRRALGDVYFLTVRFP